MTESRRFSRISFPIESELEFSDREGVEKTELIDISLNGALVTLPAGYSPEIDEYCKLRIHLLGSNEVIEMEAQVAHFEQGHMGLHCVTIDVESVTHLRKLLELNLGDPVLLERELLALGE